MEEDHKTPASPRDEAARKLRLVEEFYALAEAVLDTQDSADPGARLRGRVAAQRLVALGAADREGGGATPLDWMLEALADMEGQARQVEMEVLADVLADCRLVVAAMLGHDPDA